MLCYAALVKCSHDVCTALVNCSKWLRGQIYVYDAVGFLGLYVVYIGVVLVGRFVNQRNLRNLEDQHGIIENEERDVDSGDVEIPGRMHAMM